MNYVFTLANEYDISDSQATHLMSIHTFLQEASILYEFKM